MLLLRMRRVFTKAPQRYQTKRSSHTINTNRNSQDNVMKIFQLIFQAWVVQKTDNSIHRINHYPADSVVCFVNTYPLDSDLFGG